MTVMVRRIENSEHEYFAYATSPMIYLGQLSFTTSWRCFGDSLIKKTSS